MKRIASGARPLAADAYFITEYPPCEGYKRFELVAYVQLPKAVAYIVFSADGKAAFQKHQGALEETVKSLRSANVDYPEKPRYGISGAIPGGLDLKLFPGLYPALVGLWSGIGRRGSGGFGAGGGLRLSREQVARDCSQQSHDRRDLLVAVPRHHQKHRSHDDEQNPKGPQQALDALVLPDEDTDHHEEKDAKKEDAGAHLHGDFRRVMCLPSLGGAGLVRAGLFVQRRQLLVDLFQFAGARL
jgi:hypothetical protein